MSDKDRFECGIANALIAFGIGGMIGTLLGAWLG